MSEFITIGETMAAFTPQSSSEDPSISSDYLCVPAGAESNTAVGMARLGHSASWISRLGDDLPGRFLRGQLLQDGVDLSGVVCDTAHRTGTMIKEVRPGQETVVTYYRDHSAASFLSPEDISSDFFTSAGILHLTGITPVLSESCREAVFQAIRTAEKQGLTISFDPNIRKKIWNGTDYTPLLREILSHCQIILLGVEEGRTLFGTETAEELTDQLFTFPSVQLVGIKNGSGGAWAADRTKRYYLPPVSCRCIDPVGAGDGFNAGFLSAWLEGKDTRTCGAWGAVVGACATESRGDTPGYPDRKQLTERLQTYRKEHAK